VIELPPSEVTVDEATSTADRVLQGRAYLEAARPPSLQERFFDWLGRVFGDLLASLTSVGGRGLAYVIIGIFLVGIAYLLFRLVRDGRLPSKQTESTPDPVIDIERDLTAEEWNRHAGEAERSGDWRNGIRCRHRAMVASLIDQEFVSFRPGQTAGEIEREASRALPAAAGELREATDLFKDVWYGWVDADVDERDTFAALAERVVETATETARSASRDVPSSAPGVS